jgi:hypothetical protein
MSIDVAMSVESHPTFMMNTNASSHKNAHSLAFREDPSERLVRQADGTIAMLRHT